MKKNGFCIVVIFCLLGLMSCNADIDEVVNQSGNGDSIKELTLLGETVEIKDGVLAFNSWEELTGLASKLKATESAVNEKTRKIGISVGEISFQEDGFRSMYDVYGEALEDAPEYYESWEGYAAYKEKYSSFYFPEVGDDYSIYLPISDKNIARFANEDGFVMIDGDLMDCKDISSYEDLERLGLTPPNEKARSSKEVFYRKDGKKKLWINYSRGTHPSAEIHMEVCFRQKKIGIWFNRKASTTLALARCDENMISGTPTNIGSYWLGEKNDEFSSHDYYIAPGKFVGGGNWGYTGGVTYGPWGSTVFNFYFQR